MPRLPHVVVLAVVVSVATGCNSSKQIETGDLCSLNTDCNSPLVCSMNKCHEGCRATRDCPAGQSCLMVGGVGVCQLPAEAPCNADLPCGPLLICASDLRCRANCTSAGGCAVDQVCTNSVCADVAELVNGVLPQLQPGGGSGGNSGQMDAGSQADATTRSDATVSRFDAGTDANPGQTGFTLAPGTNCYRITSVASGYADACDIGVDSYVGVSLPGSYDPSTGTFSLGSEGALGSGRMVNNAGTLQRPIGLITDPSLPGCSWKQSNSTVIGLTGNSKFTASVSEIQESITPACGVTFSNCLSTWTWTMALDATLVAPGCTTGGSTTTTLRVTPASVDLGTVDVGMTTAPVTITVTNAGTTASGPLTVIVSGTGLTVIGCAGAALAPQSSCTISVTATPVVPGPIVGTIEVGDSPSSIKKIAVSSLSTGGGATFSLAPSPLDLGAVSPGKTVTGTVVLTNSSMAGMTGIAIAVSGSGFTAGNGTCTDTLAAGSTCNIVVNFTAGTTSGIAKGSVTVSQGGVTKIVAVAATVQAAAKLMISPSTGSFVTVVGKPSAPTTFYVANAGDVNSLIPTVTITGTHKEDFTFISDCAMALLAGATSKCSVVVTYNPKSVPATTSTATLTVTEPGTGGSSVSASLTGTAVTAGTLTLTGSATDLGTVVIGDTGTALTFTVTNNGGTDSGALNVRSDSTQFVLGSDTCVDRSLAAKQSCTFTVLFKPTASVRGVIQGTITATAAAVANPAILSITATAIPAAKLSINPRTLEFGAVTVMQESAPLTLTVSNVGGAPTGALKVENTGAQFSVKGSTCNGATLAPSGPTNTCAVIVTFTATTTSMDATGSVVVTDTTGVAGSVTTTMHGSGVPAMH